MDRVRENSTRPRRRSLALSGCCDHAHRGESQTSSNLLPGWEQTSNGCKQAPAGKQSMTAKADLKMRSSGGCECRHNRAHQNDIEGTQDLITKIRAGAAKDAK